MHKPHYCRQSAQSTAMVSGLAARLNISVGAAHADFSRRRKESLSLFLSPCLHFLTDPRGGGGRCAGSWFSSEVLIWMGASAKSHCPRRISGRLCGSRVKCQTQTETQRGGGGSEDEGERRDLGFWNLLFQWFRGNVTMKETRIPDRCPRPFPAPWSIFCAEGDGQRPELGCSEKQDAGGPLCLCPPLVPPSLAPLT